MNTDMILNILHEGKCLVKFTKVDGTIRDLLCTLRKEDLPLDDRDVPDVAKRFTPEGLVACWDLEAAAWRSFKVDSVISLTCYPNE